LFYFIRFIDNKDITFLLLRSQHYLMIVETCASILAISIGINLFTFFAMHLHKYNF